MYYPIYLDLHDRRCLVVGGGPIAVGKVSGLIEASARVTVVAPVVDARIAQWHASGKLEWHAREFLPGDIDPAFLVIAATGDRAVNTAIFQLADGRSRLANAVDDADHCNFIAPAVARAGALQVAVSTSGKSPALAKQLRDEIARDVLTPERARLAEFLGDWRATVKQALPTYQQRMAFWESVLQSQVPELLQANQSEHADQCMQALIAQAVEKN
ncbi:MAG: bifunctional precorrin-2 dehydrogenase/sirohydrochlorin ferrochelatase [Chloroflexi bacterium]|nr:bifunctional precorrin-2 dehydrogenase/sirohydrochlorin ferrochelatase [Chloroflexota bacterium]